MRRLENLYMQEVNNLRAQLQDSARRLMKPSSVALQEFSAKQGTIVDACNMRILQRQDLVKLIGIGNSEMAKNNNSNFSRFMESLFSDYDIEVFIETVLWVFRAYRSHGFQTTYWAANLDIWLCVLKEELSEDTFNQVQPFYTWLVINIPVFTHLTDPNFLNADEEDLSEPRLHP